MNEKIEWKQLQFWKSWVKFIVIYFSYVYREVSSGAQSPNHEKKESPFQLPFIKNADIDFFLY